MKISLNWLKELVDIKVSDEELIRLIGARLVEVEGVIDETHKYDNIFVVRVVCAEKIEGTHLTKCLVDDGRKCESAKIVRDENGLIQVMCGAPNVREGMLAAWLAPGAVVPASVREDAPFVIGKRRILGEYDSYGMLAGADELDFGDDHSGIVEISECGRGGEACGCGRSEGGCECGQSEESCECGAAGCCSAVRPGDTLAELFRLDDLILEIENKSLTHRPDCFGMIGFAREVAGILGQKFDYDLDICKLEEKIKVENGEKIEVKICDKEICGRYTAVILKKHGELEHKTLSFRDVILAKSGMRPVNPIVDATNYLMLLTGQPLHAFDYDKIVAVGGGDCAEVRVRLADSGEKLVLLDGKEIILNANDIVICSGDTPVALAGAMGGASTEIDGSTRNILLESATFSLYNLRKTQMAHGIFSEAITRFTKGQPAYQTLAVAGAFASMVSKGYAVSGFKDEYLKIDSEGVVKITADEINRLLGTEYSEELIVSTLQNVGFAVERVDDVIAVTAPDWRTDIHIREDIIEEVGRLLGYDNIAPTLPLHGTASKNKMLKFKTSLRDSLATMGANEVLTYSFVSERLLRRVGQDMANSYKIVNSISPELQFVRQSLVPSLLEKAYLNQKTPVDAFAIYEMNKVYEKKLGLDTEKVPIERNKIAMVLAERKGKETAFYKAKKYAAEILTNYGVKVDFVPLQIENAEVRPFEPKRAAQIVLKNGEYLGVVGEFKNSVRNEFKLAKCLAGLELDLDLILRNIDGKKKICLDGRETRDLTVTTNGTYAEMVGKIERVLAKNKIQARILPLGIYQKEATESKNITVRIEAERLSTELMQAIEQAF